MKPKIETKDNKLKPENISEDIFNWQSIVNIISDLTDVPAGIIVKSNPPYTEIIKSSDNKDNPFKAGDKNFISGQFSAKVIKTKKPLVVPNATNDDEWSDNIDVKAGMISYMGYPLLWPDGTVFGTISILDSKENRYSELARKLISQFRGLIESNLELMHNYNMLSEKYRDLKLKGSKLNNENKDSLTTICSYCKKIKCSHDSWLKFEEYFLVELNMRFSHGICSDCSMDLFHKYA